MGIKWSIILSLKKQYYLEVQIIAKPITLKPGPMTEINGRKQVVQDLDYDGVTQ